MAAIRPLPESLINRIAAGEVIERPAAALKELAENSLDAGATELYIALEDGGKSRILIRDNGHGIPKEDLALALTRHATSKLADETLVNLPYLGFRGEALPSIGAVSRLSITSRPAGESMAYRLRCEGGHMDLPTPVALPEGTEVRVEDLFYATPARLKFLRSTNAELRHSIDIMQRLALAHPAVGFTIKHGPRTLHRWPAASLLRERTGQLLGATFLDHALGIDAHFPEENCRIWGLASRPTHNRASGPRAYFFLNRRPVKDKLLLIALRLAYQDVLPHDRYPTVVIHLNLPHEEVDVNVHPAKTDVRFHNPERIRRRVTGALQEAIRAAPLENAVPLRKAVKAPAYRGPSNPPPTQPAMALDSGTQRYQAAFAPQQSPPSPTATIAPAPAEINAPPLGEARTQIRQTYIIAEAEDGLVIVDQHAAHERLVYEELRTKELDLRQEALLTPLVLSIPPEVAAILRDQPDLLQNLGFEVTLNPDDTLTITAIPALLVGRANLTQLLSDLLDELDQTQNTSTIQARIHEILGNHACRWSIRAGRRLHPDEMNALLRQMEDTPKSGQCNHGRPTFVKITYTDLERLFGRS